MTPTEKQPAEMSDTPRTDEHRRDYNAAYESMESAQDGMWVASDFAEQLERELAEKNWKIKVLTEAFNIALDALDRGGNE